MKTVRLTAAQAMVKWLSVQMTEEGERFIEGVWAIFGHGNVAGIGEALHGIGEALPTWRGQNEQTMAHAAVAYAKTKRRRKAMAWRLGQAERDHGAGTAGDAPRLGMHRCGPPASPETGASASPAGATSFETYGDAFCAAWHSMLTGRREPRDG